MGRSLLLEKGLLILMLGLAATGIYAQDEEAAVAAVLDDLHAAAAVGDWDRYFDLYAEDGVFLGTDASERWTKAEFRDYAAGSDGWVYYPQQRNINLTPDGNSAWFDELLDSVSYGTARGTGVLILTDSGWKLSQYHLTFPIPNPLARELTDTIKAFEAQEEN